MKQVAKGLRLDLAQFRELESFAQFGSDLEKDTERKIEKGKRLVEVLKQPQFNPRSLAEQVVMMYAGVNDYLNDVAVQDVTKFEAEFLGYLKRNHQDMMDKINSEKILSKEVEASLKEVITKFKGNF